MRAKLGDPVANRVGPRSRRVDVTQVFDCSRDVLFMVWTDPRHFARWWGPKEWQAYDCVLDVRSGGCWRSSFKRPGGEDIHIGGQYVEVVPPDRISFSWNSYGTLSADDESLVELEFVDLGHKTELRITHTKLTTGEAEDMDIGWVSALESLAHYLREQRPDAIASRGGLTAFQSDCLEETLMATTRPEKKRFLLLHVGFTPPTPEIMKAWSGWMASLEGIQVDAGGLMPGTEITRSGERALPLDATSPTGYNVIEAESLEAALAVARRVPFITGVRVYELRSH